MAKPTEQPHIKKPVRQATADNAPWKPVRYEIADAYAIQQLFKGSATPEAQTRALKWIIENACATHDMSYRPGAEEGRRDTDFAEGRRFVGNQIVKMLQLNTTELARREQNA